MYVLCTKKGFYTDEGQRITLGDICHARPDKIRTNGDANCYPLIQNLWPGTVIEVCSPIFWQMGSAARAFRAAQTLRETPLLGGFRAITEEDVLWYETRYTMERLIDDGRPWTEIPAPQLPGKLNSVVQRLSYISSLDHANAARLLLLCFDVRWFTYPDATSKRLRRYLRIGPLPRKMYKKEDPRFLLALNTWKDMNMAADLKYRRAKHLLEDPQAFLMKYWFEALEENESEGLADLKATKRFVDYLFYSWLDVLYPKTSDGWFMPERFFHNDKYQVKTWNRWLITHST